MSNLIVETARVFYEGSLYILLGFAIAGLLHEFLPTRWISRLIGQESPRAVLTAALFGAPIPLCSCGVLPAAAELRKKGAGRAPTMSFLVSTPETGVDSIALTYGLFGGVMAVVRPVAAVLTALVAGLLSMLVPGREEPVDDAALEDLPLHDHDHDGEEHAMAEKASRRSSAKGRRGRPRPWWEGTGDRLQRATRYGFVTLLDDLSFWLTVGLLLTGVLSAALPDDFFSTALGLDGGLLPMLVVMLAGVPLYLCASASTPVAAALVAKGLSPGAALVFLLVGPATNAATIAVVGRLLGRRQLRIYLGSIVGVSLLAGLLLDALAGDLVRSAALDARASQDPGLLAALKLLAAAGFAWLLVMSAVRTRFREGIREAREQGTHLRAAVGRMRWRDLLRPPVLGSASLLLALLWLPGAFLTVDPGQRGVVQRFGRVVAADLEPGLHLHWPPPIGRGSVVDVARIREVQIGDRDSTRAAYFVTADENLIDVRGIVQYRVDDPVRFAFGLEGADALVEHLGQRELLRIVAATPIDTLYTTQRASAERSLRQALEARLDALSVGVEVVDARLLDVHAPASIHGSFRDVASALEDRERTIHEAHAYAAGRVASADGESAELLERARATRVRARELASGSTASFRALSEVHRAEPAATETRLYLEALERSDRKSTR
ncbi:MAG: SO_0444 family Cu/Zn efflux transporter, partial [Myxococcota bacterium]